MSKKEAVIEAEQLLSIAQSKLARMRERGFYLLARTSQSHADLINQQVEKINAYERLIEILK